MANDDATEALSSYCRGSLAALNLIVKYYKDIQFTPVAKLSSDEVPKETSYKEQHANEAAPPSRSAHQIPL